MCSCAIWPYLVKVRPFWPYWPWNVKILISHNNWHPMTAKVKKIISFFIIWLSGLWKGLCDLHWPFSIFMCYLMYFNAIGTKKSEILAKITFLGIFGQILPKTPIVLPQFTRHVFKNLVWNSTIAMQHKIQSTLKDIIR